MGHSLKTATISHRTISSLAIKAIPTEPRLYADCNSSGEHSSGAITRPMFHALQLENFQQFAYKP